MDKKYLTPAEAIKALNQAKVIQADTTDGFTTMSRRLKNEYEIKVYTHGSDRPQVFRGTIRNVMKTLNGELKDQWYLRDSLKR